MSVLALIRTSHSHPNMCPSRYIPEHTHLCAGVRKLERSARLIWAHAWQHREIRMETQIEAHQLYGLCSRGMTLLVQSRVETTRCRERAVHIRAVSVRRGICTHHQSVHDPLSMCAITLTCVPKRLGHAMRHSGTNTYFSGCIVHSPASCVHQFLHTLWLARKGRHARC